MNHTRKSGHSKQNKTRKAHASISVKKTIVKQLLSMLITIKLYHWNTLSFSIHKATDDLYGDLNTLMDNMVEVLLGKHSSISEKDKHDILSIKKFNVNNYKDNGKFKKEVERYKQFLVSLNRVFNKDTDSDLLNIRDEMLAALNKLSYLLTFK